MKHDKCTHCRRPIKIGELGITIREWIKTKDGRARLGHAKICCSRECANDTTD